MTVMPAWTTMSGAAALTEKDSQLFFDDLLSPFMGPDTGTYSFNQAQEVIHTLPSRDIPFVLVSRRLPKRKNAENKIADQWIRV
jgi:hypothetical protein